MQGPPEEPDLGGRGRMAGGSSPSGQPPRAGGCPRSAGRLKSHLALGRLPGRGPYSVLFSGSKIIENKRSALKLQVKIHTIYNKAFQSLEQTFQI